MIITCPCGEKKFEIDQKLIPSKGRILQCGSCDHQWFFKIDDPEKKIVNEEILTSEKVEKEDMDSTNDETINSKKEISSENFNINNIKQKPKRNYNFLNLLLVVIIAIIALILILDTFKNNLKSVFPNINFFLNNLYQSIEDIKLFIFDLIK